MGCIFLGFFNCNGTKRATNMEKDKDQAVADIVSVENENEDEQLRQQVLQLQENLKIVTQEIGRKTELMQGRKKWMHCQIHLDVKNNLQQ